jgi:hypothetical protein
MFLQTKPEHVASRPAFKVMGGWVPMDKLIDAYVMVIKDESQRGASWAVIGSAGEAHRYPTGFDPADYVIVKE